MPDFARLEIPALFVKQRTLAFSENEGTVLQLHIFGYPDPKGTKQLVASLYEVSVRVAGQDEISLDGIEIVFHRRQDFNPMLIWAATPPWREEQTFLTPFGN